MYRFRRISYFIFIKWSFIHDIHNIKELEVRQLETPESKVLISSNRLEINYVYASELRFWCINLILVSFDFFSRHDGVPEFFRKNN